MIDQKKHDTISMCQQHFPSSFHYKGLHIFLHPEVYEPAEDTFLLLDTIDINPAESVLEIGSGTGIISLWCAQHQANVIASDINPFAIELLKKNIRKNTSDLRGILKARMGDMYDSIDPRERFDVIIFNPPYLPEGSIEESKKLGWIDTATNGGREGIQPSLRFLNKLPYHLKKRGRAYLIVSSFSTVERIQSTILVNDMHYKVLQQLRCNNELLEVYKITLNPSHHISE